MKRSQISFAIPVPEGDRLAIGKTTLVRCDLPLFRIKHKRTKASPVWSLYTVQSPYKGKGA